MMMLTVHLQFYKSGGWNVSESATGIAAIPKARLHQQFLPDP